MNRPTMRELEIVRAVMLGLTNQQVASALGISTHTVSAHLSQIFDKVGASSRLELAVFAAYHLRPRSYFDSLYNRDSGKSLARQGC